MPLKSIIDIEIADDKFQRFKDIFDRYNATLEKTPGIWRAAAKEQSAAAAGFTRFLESMRSAGGTSQQLTEMFGTQAQQLEKSAGLWISIARSSKNVLGDVVGVGASLLKWSGILGGISGLLGLGGLWGIDRMAGGVARDRRSAMGLGMNVGALKAFGIDFARLVDTNAVLGGMNEMETDISKQAPAFALLGHGLTGNTNADTLEMLKAARGLALRTPTNQLGMMFGAYGLSGMYDTETQRRLQSMSGSEFGKLLTANAKDTQALSMQDKITKGWQDLVTQLDRAGAQISKTFVTGLFPLEKPLENLSANFVKAVEAFMHTDDIKNAIASLAGGLGSLNTKFGDFLDDITNIENIVHTITHPGEAIASTFSGAAATIKDTVSSWYTAGLTKVGNLPKGLIDTIIGLESHGNPNALGPMTKYGRAMGLMGLMPATAKAYGVTHPFNAWDNERGGAALLSDLSQKYHGDVAKVLAAYNWGPGSAKDPRLDALLARHPNDWQQFVPKETKQYLLNAATLGALSTGLVVNVNVTSIPGASATASVSALAGVVP